MDHVPDPDLIGASLSDPSAFEEIFERHFDAVRRYAQARLGLDVGEDIASEAFVIAFSKRATFDPRYASARPWLMGIATNLIRRHARSELSRLKALARSVSEVSVDPAQDEAIDAARLAPLVLDVLGELQPAQRETFLLFALGQLSYEEISMALEIPIGTVRSRIFHIRRAIREREALFEAMQEWRDG